MYSSSNFTYLNFVNLVKSKLFKLKNLQVDLMESLEGEYQKIENVALCKHKNLSTQGNKKCNAYVMRYKETTSICDQLKLFENSKYDLISFTSNIKVSLI